MILSIHNGIVQRNSNENKHEIIVNVYGNIFNPSIALKYLENNKFKHLEIICNNVKTDIKLFEFILSLVSHEYLESIRFEKLFLNSSASMELLMLYHEKLTNLESAVFDNCHPNLITFMTPFIKHTNTLIYKNCFTPLFMSDSKCKNLTIVGNIMSEKTVEDVLNESIRLHDKMFHMFVEYEKPDINNLKFMPELEYLEIESTSFIVDLMYKLLKNNELVQLVVRLRDTDNLNVGAVKSMVKSITILS